MSTEKQSGQAGTKPGVREVCGRKDFCALISCLPVGRPACGQAGLVLLDLSQKYGRNRRILPPSAFVLPLTPDLDGT
ncbi:hypothetical protein, partial [Cyclobacterium roseum]|uniref:hypothetical protein n=1 Tax=Cyclobacterium roseum TaxID=2666137 RepID=UPI001F252056